MPATAKAARTSAQLRALLRFAMNAAWEQAAHIVSCYAPGTKDLVTEARRLLAWGWKEAKLAETHGHLVVEAAAEVTASAVHAARPTTFIRSEIERMENTDRLGPAGLARLSVLRAELHAI